ncbi:MAG: biopolymer transporter ExbD [Synergistaceae bacterium]|jgi:biopolymer transport protein ExbD|nr:biopolymer transporter ExbD [Synergistaceae bacterium]
MRRVRRQGADIDITPLIDVLFMLIIFFVLTTAFVRGAADVDLPDGSAPPISDRSPVVVTVTNGSGLLWTGERISRDELPARVSEVIASSGDILIAGDRDAPYGDVAELLDELRGFGVKSVGLAFDGGVGR